MTSSQLFAKIQIVAHIKKHGEIGSVAGVAYGMMITEIDVLVAVGLEQSKNN